MTLIALTILGSVNTTRRMELLNRAPATAEDYAMQAAGSVMAWERALDDGNEPQAARALNSARNCAQSAASLGHNDAAALLARVNAVLSR